MSRTPCLQQLLRNRQHAPFRHAGAADRAGILHHQDGVGRDVEAFVVDARQQVVVAVEHDRRAGMLMEPRVGGGGLDDRAVGREVAAQDHNAAFL